MKHSIRFPRRLLSLLLALLLVASLFAGLTLSAFAAPSLPSVNTKVRHIVCTSLSSKATAYYGTGQYSYAQMSQLSGVNNAEDCWATTQNNPLYTKLQTLMSGTTYNATYTGTSAGSLAYYWEKTDAQNSSSTYYCFYSDLLYGSSGFPSDMQREHIWPKSNASFYQTNGGSDLHHLRPSVGSLNNSKSNKTFGEMEHTSANTKYVVSGDASTVYWSGTYFEPKDDIKGDVARILLYVYCRWGQPNLYTDVASGKLPSYDSDDSQNNGTRAIDGRDILLKWMKNDPVDTWEMERNDLVQDVQGNRNVFIDYPEYAWLVFGLTPPSDMTTPSGMAAAGASNYTITAVSNNNSYGTVSLSGSVITATPASGYYAAGYQVTSGSATVTQSGNTFTVSAGSNCTVQIIFAQIQTYTVTYMANGYNAGSATAQAGNSVTLPSSATDVSGWTFIGWTDNSGYTNGSNQPANYYEKGTGYTVNGNVTLYAVYSQTTGGGGASTYVSTAAADVTAGQYVIGALRSDSATNNYYFATSTVSSGDITTTSSTLTVTGLSFAETALPSGAAVFTFAGDNTNGFTIDAGSGNYLGFTAASNRKLAFSSSYATTKWEVKAKANSLNANGVYLNCTSGTTYAISENSTGSGAIRGYSSGTAYRGIYLFKLTAGSGTTTYSINPSGQQHTHSMSYVAANPASCTADGNSAYYYCADCGGYFTDAAGNNPTTQAATVIAALGHNYNAAVTTAATCGAAGVRTYTCSRCGDSYTETIPATGEHNYVAAVTEPTTSAAGYTTYTCAVCGDSYVDQDSYTYRVTYLTPNGVAAPASVTSGENTLVTPPTLSDTNGWTFVGWVKNSYDNVATAPTEMIFDAENRVHVTNECLTLRALYSKTETGSGSTTVPASLTKLTTSDTISDGDKIVIVAKDTTYALYQETVNSSYVNNWTFDNAVATVAANDKNWVTFTASGTDWIIGDATNGYLHTSGSNNLDINATSTTWTLSTKDGYFQLVGNSRYLSCRTDLTSGNANYYRLGGTGSTGTGVKLFDLYRYVPEHTTSGGGSTTTYTTVFAVTCAHPNLTPVAAVAPTCETAGNSAYWICDDCGLYFSDAQATTETTPADVTIAALGHAWGSWTHVANSDPSQHQRVCATDNSHIETAACVFGEGTVTVEPSYTSAGVRTYTCPDCGYSYTETIPALTYSETVSGTYELLTDLNDLETGDKVVIYNPANSKAMTSTLVNNYYLSGADATISGTTLTPSGISSVWTVTKNQDGYTFTQDNDVALYGYVSGSYVDLATASGEGYINKWSISEVDSTNHKYSILCDGLSYTKSSTTYGSVYLEYYNSRFALYGNNNALTESDGAYLMQFYVYQAPEAQVKGVNLTLNGEIDTNAYIAIPDEVVEDGVTPVVTYVDENNQTVTVSTGDALTVADKTNGLYKFTARMPAKDMNTKVTVRLLDNNDQPIEFLDEFGDPIDSYEYSVQDYLQTVINDQTGGYEAAHHGLTDLCKAMSDYGYAAQLHFVYNTDEFPAIGGNTAAYGWYFADDIAAVSVTDVADYSTAVSGTGVKFHGASLILESETTLRFYFEITGDGSFTATVDGVSGKALTRYLNPQGEDTKYWYIDIENIAANELDNTHNVVVSDGTNSASVSSYSAYSYVKKALGNSNASDELKTLAKALKLYGAKAELYFV